MTSIDNYSTKLLLNIKDNNLTFSATYLAADQVTRVLVAELKLPLTACPTCQTPLVHNGHYQSLIHYHSYDASQPIQIELHKQRWLCRAIISAKVVLPTPGGLQKIIEDNCWLSIISRNIFPLPSNCSCPTNCAQFLGRTRLAKGVLFSLLVTNEPCFVTPSSFINSIFQNLLYKFLKNIFKVIS